MALVAATVANDGELMQPHLVTAMTGKAAGRGRSARSRWAGSSPRPIAAGDHDGDGRRRSRATLGRQFTAGREGPGRDDGRQVRHGRARRHGRAALVVHRLRPGRATRRSRSRSSSSRPAAAARSAAPIAGDLMTLYLGRAVSGPTRPRRRRATTRRDDRTSDGDGARREPRPLLERIGLAGDRARPGDPVRRRVAAASWVGGERSSAVMAGDRLPDDRRGSAAITLFRG